jgi:hypothetical protein
MFFKAQSIPGCAFFYSLRKTHYNSNFNFGDLFSITHIVILIVKTKAAK